jgi:hypothetical protein
VTPDATAPTILCSFIATLHLLICIFVQFGISDAEDPRKWIPLVVIDFPLSAILLPLRRALPDTFLVPGWVVFGVIGTLWCVLLCWIFGRRKAKYSSGPEAVEQMQSLEPPRGLYWKTKFLRRGSYLWNAEY